MLGIKPYHLNVVVQDAYIQLSDKTATQARAPRADDAARDTVAGKQ
jgi:hypothetical protein